jgi:hypothetical protein
MQNATLMSHVDTDLVTREQLALIQTPDATRSFKPVPHIELISTLEDVLRENQIATRKEQFALRRDGSTLFAVLQLAHAETADGTAALGLRTSNNRTMSIQICAGLSVFVCDNMVFRGDLIALNRKHTSRLYLKTELVQAVCRFQEHFGKLAGEIENLKARPLSDKEAKVMLHDVFTEGILPIRFLPEALLRTVCRRVPAPHRLEPAQCLHGCGQGNAHHHAHAGHSGTRTVFRHDERHE